MAEVKFWICEDCGVLHGPREADDCGACGGRLRDYDRKVRN